MVRFRYYFVYFCSCQTYRDRKINISFRHIVGRKYPYSTMAKQPVGPITNYCTVRYITNDITDSKLLLPVILVNSSSEYNIASFCTFLETAISFNAVLCEFGFKGLGNFSKENFLSDRIQETQLSEVTYSHLA